MSFQSLLYWIRPSDALLAREEAKDLLFQSLLYWIRPSDGIAPTAFLDAQQSFNPCCIGLGLQTLCQSARWN